MSNKVSELVSDMDRVFMENERDSILMGIILPVRELNPHQFEVYQLPDGTFSGRPKPKKGGYVRYHELGFTIVTEKE